MSRKTNTASKIESKVIDHEEVGKALAATDKRSRQLQEIDSKFGTEAPYDKERVLVEAKFFFEHGNQAAFELGKRLILLKEHEGHGGFIKALGSIDIDRNVAWRLMTNTAKFANVPNLRHLPQTKLLALSFMDDAEIDELAEGGTVAGIDLEDVVGMGRRQLEEALRKERKQRAKLAEENDATKEQMIAKDEKINELTGKPKPFAKAITEKLKGFVEATEFHLENLAAYHKAIENLADFLDDNKAPPAQRESVALTVTTEVEKVHRLACQLLAIVEAAHTPNINR